MLYWLLNPLDLFHKFGRSVFLWLGVPMACAVSNTSPFTTAARVLLLLPAFGFEASEQGLVNICFAT